MVITLYTIKKRHNSTQLPTYAGVNHNGTLRANCSVITPAVAFAQTGSAPTAFNYAYIPVFGRYYFINNWTYAAGQWLAEMSEDTLASWRGDIGKSNQYILRSSAESDGTIIDSMYPATAAAQTVVSKIKSPWDATTPGYVVGIIGKNSKGGAVSYFLATESEFAAMSGFLLGDPAYLGSDLGGITVDTLKVQFNPIQYIASVNAVPFQPGGLGKQTPISYGWWQMDTPALQPAGELSFQLTFPIVKHPQAPERGKYLNVAPYSAYTLFIPAFGTIPIDANIVIDLSTIDCTVTYDPKSNIAALAVYAGTAGAAPIIFKSSAQFGAPVQVGQFARDTAGAAASGFGFLANLPQAIFTGDISGIVSGATDAATSAMPQMSTHGSNGSLSEFYFDPQITAKFLPITAEDLGIGRPLYAQRTISSIPGFVMCRDVHLKISCTADEQDQIKSFMEGGFYYE